MKFIRFVGLIALVALAGGVGRKPSFEDRVAGKVQRYVHRDGWEVDKCIETGPAWHCFGSRDDGREQASFDAYPRVDGTFEVELVFQATVDSDGAWHPLPQFAE